MPRVLTHRWLAAPAMALLWASPGLSSSTRSMELTGQELQAAEQAIQNAQRPRAAMAVKAEKRVYRTSAVKYEIQETPGVRAAAAPPSYKAEIMYYKYEGGETVRVTLDLPSGMPPKVVKTETFKAYPTPLAPEEKQEAQRLAKEKVKQVSDLVAGAAPGDVVTEILSPIVSNPKLPKYNHRLVLLTLQRRSQGARRVQVEVDLTKGTVDLLSSE
jgi:hypothetical protein